MRPSELHNSLKRQYGSNVIVWLKLGDFYETFDTDAAVVSDKCNLNLFEIGTGYDVVRMCGCPCAAIESHIRTLLGNGFYVAFIDTIEGGHHA